MVENMSLHICSECGHADAIFGLAGGLAMAKEYEIPFLWQLPMNRRIRKQVSDEGLPIIYLNPRVILRDSIETLLAQWRHSFLCSLEIIMRGFHHLL